MTEGTDFRPERAYFRPERADSRPERADLRPERADSRPKRADFRPEKADFRPERADFRPERAWGDERTNGRTDKRTKVPCVLQDFIPFGAAAQKPDPNLQAEIWASRLRSGLKDWDLGLETGI